MAQYPVRIAEFDTKVDLQSIVYAADVNTAYEEIVATQAAIGTDPTNSGTWEAALSLPQAFLGRL